MNFTLIAVAVSLALGFGGGWTVQGWRWDSAEKSRVEQIHTEYVYKDRIKEKVVKEYVTQTVYIDNTTQEISDESRKVQSVSCPTLPDRFVELHDYSARGESPRPSRRPDGAPSEITPARTSETVTFNYGLYHKAELKVKALQAYITEVCSPTLEKGSK